MSQNPETHRQPETPTRKHTTDESIWLNAEPENFTARMTLHFALLRPGISYFNARTAKERGAFQRKSQRNEPI